jgi:phosphoribosylaminoimidazolecarboxamide formyltransferase/IMP cyclohydrolase
MLMQTADQVADNDVEFRVVTERKPSGQELDDLRFAWKAVKHVKSNAIVLAKDGAMVGAGAGQPNRVNSVCSRCGGGESRRLARRSPLTRSSFRRQHRVAAGGVRAVAQPGGSLRDDEVIAACDRLGVTMVFTGYRHFRH